jgi:hypothetical protein
MTVTIRVGVDTDLTTLAKILTVVELPTTPRRSQVRAAVSPLLACAVPCAVTVGSCATSPTPTTCGITKPIWFGAGFSPPRRSHRGDHDTGRLGPAPIGRPSIGVLGGE